MHKFLNSRRFRQGSVATAITVIVVAVIIVFNMLVSALSSRYSLSLDLSADQIFGISEETKSFLASLNQDVDIYILTTEEKFTANGEYFIQANEVVKKYAKGSDHVKVSYVDMVKVPTFQNRFPDLNLNTASVVVSSGDKAVDLTVYDLYNVESNPYYGTETIVSSKAEQAMTSAILKVTSDKVTRVTMLTGHNETEVTGLESLLELNNYEIVTQNLLTEEIDPDAKIAVLCAPMRDLNEDELKKLDAYLDHSGELGRSLLYFASDTQPELPNLSAFLADWGIEVADGVVFEGSLNRVMNFNMQIAIVDYTEDDYSQTVRDNNLYTVSLYARPLYALFESKGSISVEVPLWFSQTSGIIPPDAESDWQPAETDLSGPIPALIVATQTAYEGTEPHQSKVVACGSALTIDDSVISQASIGNGEYFLRLINILAEREDVVSIQSKTIGGHELGMQSTGQAYLLALLLMIILPLTVLISGIVIWMRRRHR